MSEFKKIVDQCHHFLNNVGKCCLGCEKWVYEGPRSYTVRVEPINNICPKCNKPVYSYLTEDEKSIKDIIE